MSLSEESSKEDILETARRIISLGPICDSCLDRRFAILSPGLTNAARADWRSFCRI